MSDKANKSSDLIHTSLEDDKLLTPKDIQYIFRVGKNKAYELMNSDGFPTIRLDSRLYVSRAALRKWIDTYTGKTFST